MKNLRIVLNGLSLGVICAGVLALNPAPGHASEEAIAPPADGGTCCNQSGATCYLDVGGRLIIQPGAYYSSGAC